MKRINVIGTSGSGKSTFSRKLSEKLNYPYLEMDKMFWKPNWVEASDQEFFTTLTNQISQPSWVLDGNYNKTASIKWADVDTIIWIDYSFVRTVFQAIKRALIRSITKQEFWEGTGNIETFRKSFFSKKSIIWWTLTTYKKNKIRYQALLKDPTYKHIHFVRITNPRMAKKYISQGHNTH
ncbi:AAA family ATPase [Psychromonas sp. PT13]|uniref:AAA family ATPase n=1 Tax=Psychromonas sp. PT13 TaxID=3439547 RepID=UPI003EBC355D